jgi:hypothetical protein
MFAPGIGRTRVFEDAIATTDWYMDSHEVTADRVPGSCLEGMLNLHAETKPAQVPYRCLLPVDLDNLFCIYCLSATHMGFGCLRLEPTIAHVCESAAHAVLLSLETQTPPGRLAVAALQRRLVENRIMLTRFDDFDMSCAAAWAPAVQYLGAKGFFPGYLALADAPLTRATGEAWARAFGELLAAGTGGADLVGAAAGAPPGPPPDAATRRAQAVARAEARDAADPAAGALTPEQFTWLLARERAYRAAGPEPPPQTGGLAGQAAGAAPGAEPALTRGAAAQRIVALLFA